MYDDGKKKTRIDNENCRVCGDPAAGFHFGVFTCEGCKSFFGRAHQKKLLAECKKKGKCVVNRTTRTKCKLCRLKKCFAVGMSKEASRYGRRSTYFKVHCMNDRVCKMDSKTNVYQSVQNCDKSVQGSSVNLPAYSIQTLVPHQLMESKGFCLTNFYHQKSPNLAEISRPVPLYPNSVPFPVFYASSLLQYAASTESKAANYANHSYTNHMLSAQLSSPRSSISSVWSDNTLPGLAEVEQNDPLDLSTKRQYQN